MKDNQAIQLGSGRYFQGCGVLKELGAEAARLGKRALIISDHTVFPKVEAVVTAQLAGAGIPFENYWFEGFVSPKNFDASTAQAKAMGADLVIGIGGGRCVDTAKITADKLGAPCIAVCTSASTCAACALLAVHYTDAGAQVGNYWPQRTVAVTFVDLDIVVKNCPPRFNAAGILDAMAKLPEIDYNMRYGGIWKSNIMAGFSTHSSRMTYDTLKATGKSVVEKMSRGLVDEEVDDAVFLAVCVTGMISCMAYGGKQAAISHRLYSYFCEFWPEAPRWVHGELVCASLPFQLAVNECPAAEVKELVDFIETMGLPACLDDLGFAATPEAMDDIFTFLLEKLPLAGAEECARVRKYESILAHGR